MHCILPRHKKTWLAKSLRKNKFPETIRPSLRPTFPLRETATRMAITRNWNSTRGYLAVRETSDIASKGKEEGSRGRKEKGTPLKNEKYPEVSL